MSARLFVSCVSREFRDYRETFLNDLLRSGYEVEVQEHFNTGGHTLLRKLDAVICRSDAVIHLVGEAAGSSPTTSEVDELISNRPDLEKRYAFLGTSDSGSRISYTQWEAWLSYFYKKPCFVYVAEDSASRPEDLIVEDHERQLQREHLNRLISLGKDRSSFQNRESLRVQVLQDCASHFATRDLLRKKLLGGSALVISALLAMAFIVQRSLRTRIYEFEIALPSQHAQVDVISEDTQGLLPVRIRGDLTGESLKRHIEYEFAEGHDVGRFKIRILDQTSVIDHTYRVSKSDEPSSTKETISGGPPVIFDDVFVDAPPRAPTEHPVTLVTLGEQIRPIRLRFIETRLEAFRDGSAEPFFLSENEISNKQFALFLRAQSESFRARAPEPKEDDLPASEITPSLAIAYCEWLNDEVDGKLSYRLPTLIEWGIATDGYLQGYSKSRLSESDLIEAVHFESGKPRAVTIGQQNRFGVRNLFGNVAELCEVPNSLQYDHPYVLVGGTFLSSKPDLSKKLPASDAEIEPSTVGFRVAATLSDTTSLTIVNRSNSKIRLAALSLLTRSTFNSSTISAGDTRVFDTNVPQGWVYIAVSKSDGSRMKSLGCCYLGYREATRVVVTEVNDEFNIATPDYPGESCPEENP